MKKGNRIQVCVTAAVGMVLVLIVLVMLFSHHSDMEMVVEDEGVLLRLMCSRGDNSWVQAITDIVGQFEQQNPDIRIELVESDDEGLYDDYLVKQIAMDSLGDIVELRRCDFVEEGYMAPLPAEVTEGRGDVYEKDGVVYGIGMSVLSTGILYNKQIFRMLDLEEPDTYGDFLLLCQELEKKGYTPISVGGGTGWHMGFWLNHFYLTDIIMSDPEWPQRLRDGDASWMDACVGRMFTDVYNLFNSGYIGEDWMAISDGMMPVRLAGGRTAMVYSGHWLAREVYEQNPNIELGWFYLPDENGQVIVRDIQESYWGISAECAKNPQRYSAAVAFLQFFYSADVYTQFCRDMGAVSNNKSVSVVYDIQAQQEIAEKFYAEKNHSTQFLCDDNYPHDFLNKLLDIEYALIQDQISVGDAQRMCEEAYRESEK